MSNDNVSNEGGGEAAMVPVSQWGVKVASGETINFALVPTGKAIELLGVKDATGQTVIDPSLARRDDVMVAGDDVVDVMQRMPQSLREIGRKALQVASKAYASELAQRRKDARKAEEDRSKAAKSAPARKVAK